MYNPTFIGDIDLNEETLAHYGVKGMKWRKRKAKLKSNLKWKVSKVKNKALEVKANALRRHYNPVAANANLVSKNIGALNKNSKYQSIDDAFRWYDKYDSDEKRGGQPGSRGELRRSTGYYERDYRNASNLDAGIKAGRERVAAEKKKKKK